MCIISALIGYVLPESVYVWFLGEKYAESKYYVVMYLVGYGANLPYLMLVNYLFFHAKNKLIASVTFISSIFYVVLMIILGQYSIEYIPYALILSNILMVFILWFMISKKA